MSTGGGHCVVSQESVKAVKMLDATDRKMVIRLTADLHSLEQRNVRTADIREAF